jgi:hypothetical protein
MGRPWRFTPLALPSILSLVTQCCCVQGCSMKLVQWNIHGECFVECSNTNVQNCDHHYPKCKEGALDYLRLLLRGGDEVPSKIPDFVAVQQLGDQAFIDQGGIGTHRLLHHVCGGEDGFGSYPFDVAVLLYNEAEWKPITRQHGGCMERIMGKPYNNYRAFLMRGFERQDGSGERVLVVSAHFSHSDHGLDDLSGSMKTMMGEARTERVVMMADTNRECSVGSWDIVQGLLPATSTATSSQLFHTCCQPEFFHCYDRIMALGIPDAQNPMRTVQPFGHTPPDYAAFNMHDPIIAHLDYPTCYVAPQLV